MKPLLRVAFAMAGLAALATVSACDPGTPYAAIVNGQRISQSQITRELKALSGNKAFVAAYDQSASGTPGRSGILTGNTANATYTQSFAAAVLGLEVQAAVVHAEVIRRHLEPPASAVTAPATEAAAGQQFGTDTTGKAIFPSFNAWFRHLFDQHKAEEDALAKGLGTTAVDAAAVQKFYDDNPQDFISNQCTSHILVASQAQAAALRAQIAAGADFAGIAAQNSTDATTAGKGGDLGCGVPGQGTNPVQQDQAFVVASSKAPIGQVSQPVQLSSGWDLIKVASRTVQPLTDQIKAAIRQQLQTQASQPLNQFFQQAAKTLKVTINPQYGHWDNQQLAVVPPNAPDPVKSGLPNGTTTIPPAAGGGTPSPANPATPSPANPATPSAPATADTTPATADTTPATPSPANPATPPPANPTPSASATTDTSPTTTAP